MIPLPLGLVLCGLLVLAAEELYLWLSLSPRERKPSWKKAEKWSWNGNWPSCQSRKPSPLEGEQGLEVTVELSPRSGSGLIVLTSVRTWD